MTAILPIIIFFIVFVSILLSEHGIDSWYKVLNMPFPGIHSWISIIIRFIFRIVCFIILL